MIINQVGPRGKALLFVLAWFWAATFTIAIMVGITGAHIAPTVQAHTSACAAPAGAMFNPCARLDTTQVQDQRAPTLSPECDEVIALVYRTHDYTGGPEEQICLGQEDDPRVGLALDYGMSADEYAAAERAQR